MDDSQLLDLLMSAVRTDPKTRSLLLSALGEVANPAVGDTTERSSEGIPQPVGCLLL